MLRSRTVREGSVGLFVILGLILFGGLFIWLRGIRLGKSSYTIVVQFPDVYGIKLGGSVSYRGAEVGKITKVEPTSDGVDVTIEISPASLSIPREVTIQTNRSGLLGEAFVDIVPSTLLGDSAKSINPVTNCDPNLILCDGDRLQGESSVGFEQLLPNTVRLTKLYSREEFYTNLNSAVKNASQTALEISELSRKLSTLATTVREEVKDLSGKASTSLASVNETSSRIGRLADNLNGLVSENRGNLTRTINTIDSTSNEVKTLVAKFNSAIESTDTKQLFKNIEVFSANAAETSVNLRDISASLNKPSNILAIQQTLDSARATFANTQKITADLDELTGDPNLRGNMRKLINGLSNLVSSAEQLEQPLKNAQSPTPITPQFNYTLTSSNYPDLVFPVSMYSKNLHPFSSAFSVNSSCQQESKVVSNYPKNSRIPTQE